MVLSVDDKNQVLEVDTIKAYAYNANGEPVDVQTPLPTDGDSLYEKDIWLEESSSSGFTGGDVHDLVNNLHTVLINETTDNPKEIFIHLKRTTPFLAIGLGAYTGDFSNVKISGLTSGMVEFTLYDGSTDNTKKTTLTIFTPAIGLNALKVEFLTADTVSLSNIYVPKAVTGIMRIQGQKPNGDFTEFQSTVSGNFKTSLEELESDISVNSNTQLKTTLFDSSGNEAHMHVGNDGHYHLGTSMLQNIELSDNNTTIVNLASGATFTGVAEETYGASTIQLFHFADQDCTIYIDQGWNGITFELSDSFDCLANEACSRTFLSVAPYFRLRVTNDGLSATTDHKSSCALVPVLSVLPRSLSTDDRLKTESTLTSNQTLDRHADVSPTNSLSTITPVRLVGTNFDGTIKDPNFWTETVTGSGSVSQSGEIELKTGITLNSTAKYETVRRARFVVGSALKFQSITKFVTAGTVDNIRRIGAYDTTDGFFFQLDGTTFSVGTRNNSVDTLINSGSFNGNKGPSYIMDQGYHNLTIEWAPKGVFFYIDNILLHKIGDAHLSRYLSLPASFENINDNGSIIDITFDCVALAITRMGELKTNATYKYLGANATTILKHGAGVLHTIVNVDNSGSVSVYDGLAAVVGTEIAIIDTAKALGTLTFDAPFNDGLTVVVAGGAKITVTYE